MLCEYKVGIKRNHVQKEEDCIKVPKASVEMNDDSIFAHISSNISNSYDFIVSKEEQP